MFSQLVATLVLFFPVVIATRAVKSIDDQRPLHINFLPAANRVRLGESLTIYCALDAGPADIDTGTSVFLFCPIAPWNSFCYQNCKSACAAEAPGQCPYEKHLGAVSCRTVVEPNGRVTYEYTIGKLTANWIGQAGPGFYCKSAGSRTNEVWLEEDPIEHVVETTTTTTKSVEAVKVSERPVEEPNVQSRESTPPPELVQGALLKNRYTDDKTSAILRELLVIFAIVIVFVSVSINIFCCIRCALIRQYTKCKQPPRMLNLFCMTEEVRNARLARHALPGYWEASNHQKPALEHVHPSHVSHVLADGSYIYDGHLLNHPRPLIAESSGLILPPSDLMTSGMGHASSMYGADTNSNASCMDGRIYRGGDPRLIPGQENTFSVTPDSSVIRPASSNRRRSKTSSIILVPGPNGLQAMRVPSESQNNPLAAAVASYCVQQQQNLIELQKRLNFPELSRTASSNGRSDGMASGVESVGIPDPAILDSYQTALLDMAASKASYGLHPQHHPDAASLQGSGSIRVPMTTTNAPPVLCSENLYRLLPTAPLNSVPSPQFLTASSSPLHRQLGGSSSNPHISPVSHAEPPVGLSPSHSDSGNASGSGQFAMPFTGGKLTTTPSTTQPIGSPSHDAAIQGILTSERRTRANRTYPHWWNRLSSGDL